MGRAMCLGEVQGRGRKTVDGRGCGIPFSKSLFIPRHPGAIDHIFFQHSLAIQRHIRSSLQFLSLLF
jgi:hypothetical protein